MKVREPQRSTKYKVKDCLSGRGSFRDKTARTAGLLTQDSAPEKMFRSAWSCVKELRLWCGSALRSCAILSKWPPPLWALFVSCVEQVSVALIGSHKLKCPQRQEKEVKQGSPGWEEVVRVGVEVRIAV